MLATLFSQGSALIGGCELRVKYIVGQLVIVICNTGTLGSIRGRTIEGSCVPLYAPKISQWTQSEYNSVGQWTETPKYAGSEI